MPEGHDASVKSPTSSAKDGSVLHPTTQSDKDWKIYGSSLADYNTDFRTVLGHRTIEDLINGIQAPVVVDALAPASTLRELLSFRPKANQLGIAITLEDLRTKEEAEKDKSIGITQISGDITRPQTLLEVLTTLNGRKADLIMERGWYGLDNIPIDSRLYNLGITTAWNLLNKDGTLLAQLPPDKKLVESGLNVSKWIKELQNLGIHSRYDQRPYGTIIISKTSSSPSALPHLAK